MIFISLIFARPAGSVGNQMRRQNHFRSLLLQKFETKETMVHCILNNGALYSPADIQLDPEVRFKLFFLADSCCLDVTITESD